MRREVVRVFVRARQELSAPLVSSPTPMPPSTGYPYGWLGRARARAILDRLQEAASILFDRVREFASWRRCRATLEAKIRRRLCLGGRWEDAPAHLESLARANADEAVREAINTRTRSNVRLLQAPADRPVDGQVAATDRGRTIDLRHPQRILKLFLRAL